MMSERPQKGQFPSKPTLVIKDQAYNIAKYALYESKRRRLTPKTKKVIIILSVILTAGIISGLSIFFGLYQVRLINFYVNNGQTPTSYTCIIPRDIYISYSTRDHPSHSYSNYDTIISVIESYCTPEEPEIVKLANQIKSQCVDQANDEEVLNALLSFTQGIEYKSELLDVAAYPLETIFNRGDCEDLCIVYGSLVESIGYQAILMCVLIYDTQEYEWMGHVVVGVYLPFTPTAHSSYYSWYYDVGGEHYWICETTDQGWMIGELPVQNEADIQIMSYAFVS
jgi:hypothetical protein